MFRLIAHTSWFYGEDIYVDLLSVLVVLIILIYSIKYYKLNKKRVKYKYLILSFGLLAVSFVAKIISHFTIYSTDIHTRHLGIISLTYQTISHSVALIFWGLLVYKILSTLALYMFYLIYAKKQDGLNLFFAIYLIILVNILGHAIYFTYYLTNVVLLVIILITLFKIYFNKKFKTMKQLIIGFSLILVSQLIFIFIATYATLYDIGEFVQLLGYLIILFGFLKVIIYEKKKKRSNRHT